MFPRRRPTGKMKCHLCGIEFQPNVKHQKFCSMECKLKEQIRAARAKRARRSIARNASRDQAPA